MVTRKAGRPLILWSRAKQVVHLGLLPRKPGRPLILLRLHANSYAFQVVPFVCGPTQASVSPYALSPQHQVLRKPGRPLMSWPHASTGHARPIFLVSRQRDRLFLGSYARQFAPVVLAPRQRPSFYFASPRHQVLRKPGTFLCVRILPV